MTLISRRRFLTIAGTALGASLLPNTSLSFAPSLKKITWIGTALGAESSLTLYHTRPAYAEQIIQQCRDEILRLEKIFSLFQRDSKLVALNKAGHLSNPPPELVDILRQARNLSKLSHGVFDVSIQPLWVTYARHFQQVNANPKGPSLAAMTQARNLVGWQNIDIQDHALTLRKKGMALSLNGIAQGYITDQITHFLKSKGFGHILVNMGEFRALGHHPDQQPWQIQLGDQDDAPVIALNDQAVATSSANGTFFDLSGKHHHLFDPHTGKPSPFVQQVSVTAPTATLADALSTTLAITNDTSLLKHFAGTKAYIQSI